MKSVTQITNDVARSRAQWLERHIGDLLAAGVRQSDIEIQEHPNMRTVISVRGVPSFEWRPLLGFISSGGCEKIRTVHRRSA